MSTASTEHPILPLSKCIEVLKQLGFDRTHHHHPELAELAASSVALLLHLHADRKTIESSDGTFPQPKEIVAISALFSDQELFAALLSMLSSTNPSEIESAERNRINTPSYYHGATKMGSQGPNKGTSSNPSMQNRKRSLSTASDTAAEYHTPSKAAKTMISPKPVRKEVNSNFNPSAVPFLQSPLPPSEGISQTFDLNMPVLAANIFYSALCYLDHWPSVLLKAYSEDSFGAKIWVDDERCYLFTSNLKLALQSETRKQANDQNSNEAEMFRKNFETFFNGTESIDNNSETNTPLKKNSEKIIDKGHIEARMNTEVLMQREDGSDSDSGDEEYVIEVSNDGFAFGAEASSSTTLRSIRPVDDKRPTTPAMDIQPRDNILLSAGPNADDSSSSGEEEVVCLDQASETNDSKIWWTTKSVDLASIRDRFTHSNLNQALSTVTDALESRLAAKTKQNSRLLSTLPAFTAVSPVRKLVASHLEKWLQSPAVSSLAKQLYTVLCKEIRNVNPLIDDDVSTLNSILSMNLKASHFTTHVENVKSIIKTAPTLATSRQIISYLLNEELEDNSNQDEKAASDGSDSLKLLKAVVETCSKQKSDLGYKALASATLDLIRSTQGSRIADLVKLIRKVTAVLGQHYDGYQYVKGIVDMHKVEMFSTDIDPDEVAAVIFEAVTVMTPGQLPSTTKRQRPMKVPHGYGRTTEQVESSEKISIDYQKLGLNLFRTRKIILHWGLFIYATSIHTRLEEDSRLLKGETILMSDISYHDSFLDGRTESRNYSKLNPTFDKFMTTMRCLLFLAEPDSKELIDYLKSLAPKLMPEDDNATVFEVKRYQVKFCSENGVDVDSDVIWKILNAVKTSTCIIDPLTGISLLEQLMYHCKGNKNGKIIVKDETILTELYKLANFDPSRNALELEEGRLHMDNEAIEENKPIPSLACSGIWWRITIIGLIIAGSDPKTLGRIIWEEYPTVKVLIKMITAGSYMFPTIDCNDEQRGVMRSKEVELRDKESTILHSLYFPTASEEAPKEKTNNDVDISTHSRPTRLRVSARQREKQEKLDALRREKEASEALAELTIRKKKIKALTKLIMMGHPKSEARKAPNKTTNQLILSVNTLFHLSKSFRNCTDPDYLLNTIGDISRDGIQRAYVWLIPVISSQPEMIRRLPSSASCVLLLRAYGEDGIDNNQLLELSTPLLDHVTSCISGQNGEKDCKVACEIVSSYISSEESDKRRCARRVLQRSVGKRNNTEVKSYPGAHDRELSWLTNLVKTEDYEVLLQILVPHLLKSLAYERGEVLRSYLFALHNYFESKSPEERFQFSITVCDFLSSRPQICSTMDRELQHLMISLVCSEYEKEKKQSTRSFLRAAIVLISNWSDDEDFGDKDKNDAKDSDVKSEMLKLVNYLMPSDRSENDTGTNDAENGKVSLHMEEWVLLAKSQCNWIARRSALSAPDVYLPRLLLCCGLPQSSLLSMIERLGKLGEDSTNKEECYNHLFSPSVISQWGTKFVGKREYITRKLLGRIDGYTNLLYQNDASIGDIIRKNSSFISWLKRDCESTEDKRKKGRLKKATHKTKLKSPHGIQTLSQISDIIADVASSVETKISNEIKESTISDSQYHGTLLERLERSKSEKISTERLSTDVIEQSFSSNEFSRLEHFLRNSYSSLTDSKIITKREVKLALHDRDKESSVILEDINRLFVHFNSVSPKPTSLVPILLEWLPLLTRIHCDESFWKILFSETDQQDISSRDFSTLLVSQCLANWPSTTILSCQRWILSQISQHEFSHLSVELALKCIVRGSDHISGTKPADSNVHILSSLENTTAAVLLAVEGAKNWWLRGNKFALLDQRALLPSWFMLMILIGNCGKKHLDLMINEIVKKLSSDGWDGDILLPATLLRMYAQYPFTMNLGNAKIRKLLVETSITRATEWLASRTPLDDQIHHSISNLTTNINPRQHMLICDVFKKHPLIAIRHLRTVADVLYQDGSVKSSRDDIRSRLTCISSSPLLAGSNGSFSKVKVSYWGCSFTEYLWVSTLECIMSMPQEVLFICGDCMGLYRILDLYLMLIMIQLDMDGSANIQRTKGGYTRLVKNFYNSNMNAFTKWSESVVDELKTSGRVADLLQICGIHFSSTMD